MMKYRYKEKLERKGTDFYYVQEAELEVFLFFKNLASVVLLCS